MNFSRASRSLAPAPSCRGFTLTELLVVIAILAILSSASIASFSSIERGISIRSASDMIDSQLEQARTDAISSNKTTIVRLYQYSDGSLGENPSDASTGKYRALQLFQINSDGSLSSLGPVVRLPKSTYVASSTTISNLVGKASSTASPFSSTGAAQGVSLPGVNLNYNCVSIQFFPDGSTDLDSSTGPWFMTVVNLQDASAASGTPKNFSTLQIQPSNGNIQIYRP